MDGILRCSKYAFGPNRLHLCGPANSRALLDGVKVNSTNSGTKFLLEKFESMYPYLKHIARANGIRDPFDDRVVEAYWLGNSLLERVRKKDLYSHLSDGLNLRTRMKRREFSELKEKIGALSVPHHAFHVFHVWKSVGWKEKAETVEQLDSCRVSAGKVAKVDGPWITVLVKPILVDDEQKLVFGDVVEKRISRSLGADMDIDLIKVGDIITMHWEVPCEVITPLQAKNIERYTQMSLDLANS